MGCHISCKSDFQMCQCKAMVLAQVVSVSSADKFASLWKALGRWGLSRLLLWLLLLPLTERQSVGNVGIQVCARERSRSGSCLQCGNETWEIHVHRITPVCSGELTRYQQHSLVSGIKCKQSYAVKMCGTWNQMLCIWVQHLGRKTHEPQSLHITRSTSFLVFLARVLDFCQKATQSGSPHFQKSRDQEGVWSWPEHCGRKNCQAIGHALV